LPEFLRKKRGDESKEEDEEKAESLRAEDTREQTL